MQLQEAGAKKAVVSKRVASQAAAAAAQVTAKKNSHIRLLENVRSDGAGSQIDLKAASAAAEFRQQRIHRKELLLLAQQNHQETGNSAHDFASLHSNHAGGATSALNEIHQQEAQAQLMPDTSHASPDSEIDHTLQSRPSLVQQANTAVSLEKDVGVTPMAAGPSNKDRKKRVVALKQALALQAQQKQQQRHTQEASDMQRDKGEGHKKGVLSRMFRRG